MLVGGNLTVLAAGAGTPLTRSARDGIAVLEELPLGHVPRNLPVALGVPARVDGRAGTLRVGPLVA